MVLVVPGPQTYVKEWHFGFLFYNTFWSRPGSANLIRNVGVFTQGLIRMVGAKYFQFETLDPQDLGVEELQVAVLLSLGPR